MLKKRESSSRSKVNTEINAGSMADIAFLLLIFFLVTTTIEVDKGILVRLPPWSDEDIEAKIKKRNVLSVLVNANNQLLVRGEEMDVNNLKEKVIEFITNPQMKSDFPLTPQEAIVSLQNDRGTEYNTYIQVYNELQAAYNQLRNEEAERQYGTIFDNLNRDQKKQIIEKYPMKLSEADPTEFGEETQ